MARVSDSKKHEDRGPLSFAEIRALGDVPATRERPEAMRSFLGWSGLMFEALKKSDIPRVGFQSLARHKQPSAWIISATDQYRLGLPVLAERTLQRKRVADRKVRAHPAEPVHHAWNALRYHPIVVPPERRWERDEKGRRVLPTAPDAILFNGESRVPFFPQGYPWHCVGRIESASGDSMGSAALIGRDLVLTARHCVPKGTSSVKFIPAFFEGYSTLGCTVFSWVKTISRYAGTETGAWDFALLRLYQPLGDLLGYFGVRSYNDNWNDMSVWTNVGYPSMAPFDNVRPSYLGGFQINGTSSSGDALELQSDDQDSSKGNSGGPVWAVWSQGPYIVGVDSCIRETSYGPFGSDIEVIDAGGKAMVDLIGLARLKIETSIHVKPPTINLGG